MSNLSSIIAEKESICLVRDRDCTLKRDKGIIYTEHNWIPLSSCGYSWRGGWKNSPRFFWSI